MSTEPPEPTIAQRNALVARLLADLAAPCDATAVDAALGAVRADGGDAIRDLPDDLASLRGDPAQRQRARAVLERYRAAVADAPRGTDLDTRLGQARVLFAAALYFEVHEVLEPVWRDAAGDGRRFLQGLIQAAVAWHHGTRGRTAPALRAAVAAAAKLADAPDRWHGFPVAALRGQLAACRDAVASDASPTPPRLTT